MSVTKPVTKACQCGCGAGVQQAPTGRPRRFATAACRQRSHRQRRRTPVYYRHKSDEWSTPPDLFAALAEEFGRFDLDAAATSATALAHRYYTAEDDGLVQPWSGTVWCNPPYSRVGAFVVVLVPARTDTKWWHESAVEADEIRFLRGRLRFGNAKAGAPFPSAVLVFRPTADAP